VGIIRVGAATEVEMKEKKDRVDDAQHATKAAVEEGIVAGGGTALINCISELSNALQKEAGDLQVGMNIVLRALEIPTRIIASNSGQEASVIIEKLKKEKAGIGFNAQTGKFEDMFNAGIVDPFKVTRSALQNAASIVGLLLTTDVLIADKPEEKKEPVGAGNRPMPGMNDMDF